MNETRAERRSLTIHLGSLLEEQEKSKVPAIFVKEIRRARRKLKGMVRKMKVIHSHEFVPTLDLLDGEEVV